jgi:hypothetical protein
MPNSSFVTVVFTSGSDLMVEVNFLLLCGIGSGRGSIYPGSNHAMIDRLPALSAPNFHIVKTGSPT